MFEKEIATLRKALKMIDHQDERELALRAEAALDILAKHLATQTDEKKN